ncbi:MAG: NUDIX hydrolase [Candidatus Dojkabacteria bacterium]|nr:NUDIX hydrolase [Candidatus Dojkabacteria bacterium]MDQ7020369.1 NUDIX hydrolase [Candidatus Dojkabacteria bacterium]
MTRSWITSTAILSLHEQLPVRQVYLWCISKDDYIVVAGRNDKWQFPGGKPDSGESKEQALEREVFEESGIKLNEYSNRPTIFGYYLIEDDPNWPNDKAYSQLRFILRIDKDHKEISLSNNEKVDEATPLEDVRWVKLDELSMFNHSRMSHSEFESVLTSGIFE